MNVASLFAKLGIEVDRASFAAADAALLQVRAAAESAMAYAASNAAHFDQIVLDTSRKARAGSGEATEAVMEFGQGAEQAAEGTSKWSNTLLGVTIAAGALFALLRGAQGLYGLVTATAAPRPSR